MCNVRQGNFAPVKIFVWVARFTLLGAGGERWGEQVMEPPTPRLFLQWLGCVFALNALVGAPFYITTAAKWEKVFNVGGVLGFLLFQCVVFLVPSSLAVLVWRGVVAAVSRLPKTLLSVATVCAVGLALSFLPRWASEGHARGWRLLGMTTSGAIFVGVLLGGRQAYQAISGNHR